MRTKLIILAIIGALVTLGVATNGASKPTQLITTTAAHTASPHVDTASGSKTTPPAPKTVTMAPTAATVNKPVVKPTIPVTPVTSTVQNTSTPTVAQPTTASSDKCYDASKCLNPNRPSFDGWGNEWDYLGNLIHATCPNVNDPISGQPNPECVCPANTPEGVYYIQGYDKTTNAVVCGFGYYHACPYADAQPADGPVCAKLTAEQGGTQ